MKIDPDDSAFPEITTKEPDERRGETVGYVHSVGGMTLRTYIAAKFMAAEIGRDDGNRAVSSDSVIAFRAVQLADTLIAELNK